MRFPASFKGVVRVKEPLRHKVIEAHFPIGHGYAVFYSEDEKTVIFHLQDAKKGMTTVNGELKVKVPFSFSYNNRGIR
jgi:hypothetical protein